MLSGAIKAKFLTYHSIIKIVLLINYLKPYLHESIQTFAVYTKRKINSEDAGFTTSMLYTTQRISQAVWYI